jgi:tetratricopeptide (TPR) repeat protein
VSGNYDAAISCYNEAISGNPDSDLAAEAKLAIADIYGEKKQYELAIQLLNGIISSCPKYSSRAQLQLGLCYKSEGKVSEAVTTLKTGVQSSSKSDGNRKDMMNLLGDCYIETGALDRAIENYQVAGKEYPDESPHSQLMIAVCLRQQCKYPDAIAILKKGIDAAPDANPVNKDMMYCLGDCYREEKDFDNAVTAYQAYGGKYADGAQQAQLMVAICRKDQQRYTEAIDVLKKTVESAPPASSVRKDILSILGECYRAAKSFDNAISSYQRLAAEFPEQAMSSQLAIADCYSQQGNYQQAVVVLKAGMGASPAGSPIRKDFMIRLGECYRHSGDSDSAVATYQSLSKDYPDFAPRALLLAGVCRKDQKKYPEAAVVCYVNSSADVKTVSDICCTSSSALKIVRSLPNRQIIVIPDKNLG